MSNISLEQAAALLKSWDYIQIVCHRLPDGDALGSSAALGRALLSLGKHVMFRCANAVPEKFMYLFETVPFDAFAPQHIVTVDVADRFLLGALEPLADSVDLAIDHHATHRDFAKEQWVDGGAAACCMMIAKLISALGAEITPEIADALYTGIATDTGCFRYSNVRPETHRIAAELIEHGAHTAQINNALFETKSRAAIRLETRIYSDMEFFFDGKCAMICLTNDLIRETGATESDLDGISALIRQVEGVLCGVTIRQQGENEYKVSFRTVDPVDGAAIAAKFGGGGHKFAAGCTLKTNLETAKERLIAACGEALKSCGQT